VQIGVTAAGFPTVGRTVGPLALRLHGRGLLDAPPGSALCCPHARWAGLLPPRRGPLSGPVCYAHGRSTRAVLGLLGRLAVVGPFYSRKHFF